MSCRQSGIGMAVKSGKQAYIETEQLYAIYSLLSLLKCSLCEFNEYASASAQFSHRNVVVTRSVSFENPQMRRME